MHDQATIWITDTDLAVTSFTARLRDLAGLGDVYRRVHVSDLWGHDEPYGVIVVAHRWALDGQAVSFEAPAYDSIFRFQLEPLQAPDGRIVGVNGRAFDTREAVPADFSPATLADAERQAGLGTWTIDLSTGQVSVSPGLCAILGRRAARERARTSAPSTIRATWTRSSGSSTIPTPAKTIRATIGSCAPAAASAPFANAFARRSTSAASRRFAPER